MRQPTLSLQFAKFVQSRYDMIKPGQFPYIKNIHVNNCYTYRDFDIKLHDYKPFSHLILTGRNGSGKSTILNALNNHLLILLDIDPSYKGDPNALSLTLYQELKSQHIAGEMSGWKNIEKMNEISSRYGEISKISIYEDYQHSNKYAIKFSEINKRHVIFHLFKARRWANTNDVEVPTKEKEFIDALTKIDSGIFLNKNFQQYLVNKRVNQAFDIIDNRNDSIKETESFFDKITKFFQILFDDNQVKINFIRENYEINIELSDKRTIKLKDLPEGFSGFLSIFLDLLIRVDIIQKQVRDSTYDPTGIVLIDEPEVHLHLELQEQVLPMLIELFPNIQFIVATHSPAVVASIKGATIFDLTTKETRTSEDTVGRSYAELTTSHFGLDNEYSTIADNILRQINDAARSHEHEPALLKQALERIAIEQGPYLSPTLRVEMELLIAKAEAKQAIAR